MKSTKIESGARVQILVRTQVALEIKTGTVKGRTSVGFYDVLIDGDRSPCDVERLHMTVLPQVDPLGPAEREVVSRLKITRKLDAVRACPECQESQFSCVAHREV